MWYKRVATHIELKVMAKPNAKRSALIAINDQGLHISLQARPVQGAANDELINYLATIFKIPKSHISLKRGENSRYKWVTLPINPIILSLINDPDGFIAGKLGKNKA